MRIHFLIAFLITLLFAACAHAQECGPAPMKNPETCTNVSGPMVGYSSNGGWLFWTYKTPKTPVGKLEYYFFIGTWDEIKNVSARIDTIRRAVNPLLSLQTLPSRIKIKVVDDPSLALVLNDAKADIKARVGE